VKEAMSRQVEKEVASLKKKLEIAERKAYDAADDLQAVAEGKFSRSPKIDSMCPLFPDLPTLNGSGAKETEDALKKELAETKYQVKIIQERTAEVRQGE
jgi:acetyl-CoA carboxylase alpha subunit